MSLNRIKSFVRVYFEFSKNEVNGFIALFPAMTFLLFIPTIYKASLSNEDAKGTNKIATAQLLGWAGTINVDIIAKNTEEIKIKSFRFNPNTASIEDFKALGFREKIAQNIDRYRQAGGKFKSKESLSKIYGISKPRLKELRDYIDIPVKKHPSRYKKDFPKKTKQAYKKFKKYTPKTYSFELNSVPADSLVKIRGIGNFYSKNIVEYRDKLGGYTNLNQLNEVFGMKQKAIDSIAKSTTIDLSLITKINVNTDSFKLLLNHPYISYNLAGAIISYKNQHGDYTELEDLKSIRILSDSVFSKLKPYLEVVE